MSEECEELLESEWEGDADEDKESSGDREAVYLQVARWVQDQPRWVNLPQIMKAFGLSRTQVYSHIVTLRKRFPGCLEEKRERRGTHNIISVRMIEGWSIPKPSERKKPITCHYLPSVEGMVVPIPKLREHCCWLQLIQRPWREMRLTRSEVEQVLRTVKKVKEGTGGGDNQSVSDICGYL
ncbi:hypothetical protein ACK34J_05400 [Aeromonas veronii]